VNVLMQHPHRHDPPPGWSRETFEAVTSALAAALVGAYRRDAQQRDDEREETGR
jgi:hypothetical protein